MWASLLSRFSRGIKKACGSFRCRTFFCTFAANQNRLLCSVPFSLFSLFSCACPFCPAVGTTFPSRRALALRLRTPLGSIRSSSFRGPERRSAACCVRAALSSFGFFYKSVYVFRLMLDVVHYLPCLLADFYVEGVGEGAFGSPAARPCAASTHPIRH